ncbi:MAG TPA: tetratricopeptide repeat protein [Verrucomicrobiae bacterium]|jgi:tetratricopeptide (TPR) repeat protein|nr:tetratricopeptide repeat protein [Verrucomicrobiae bacterium]
MLTTKNAGGDGGSRAGDVSSKSRTGRTPLLIFPFRSVLPLAFAVVLTGCQPPGPRALLDGQRLIERGQYSEAIDRLKTATSILSTNAQAWNYLGLAYHQAGQANDAADAYRKALALDQNLVEVHYNLGCLWLEQNRPDLARPELTAYTLRRDKSPEGWIKLGEAQLALRDLVGAERSLNQARQFDEQNPEALNDLGVVQMQRNRGTEAAQYFGGALKAKPDYGPAILNLAIVSQTHLNNRQYALQRYQDYLALKPRPANWDAVDAAARALQQEMSSTAPTVAARPAAPTNTTPAAVAPRPPSNVPARTVPPKLETSTPAVSRPTSSGPTSPVEVVQIAPEPVIRPAQDSGNSTHPIVSSNSAGGSTQSEHRGFFSRVNPANLFRGNSHTNPSATADSSETTRAPLPTPEPPVTYPRYHFHSLKKPAAGDRTAADKAFADASKAYQAGELPEAMAAYSRATKADPAYFDPYYNLGIVSVEAGNLPQALLAYETALAIQPDSHDARFNFALALKRANYPVDAASELEKVLAKTPSDINARYALANLYAQQLRQSAKAREHYQKILELNPSFPQASSIHDWLWANPS